MHDFKICLAQPLAMRLACDASGGTGVDCGWSASAGVASQFVRFSADVRFPHPPALSFPLSLDILALIS